MTSSENPPEPRTDPWLEEIKRVTGINDSTRAILEAMEMGLISRREAREHLPAVLLEALIQTECPQCWRSVDDPWHLSECQKPLTVHRPIMQEARPANVLKPTPPPMDEYERGHRDGESCRDADWVHAIGEVEWWPDDVEPTPSLVATVLGNLITEASDYVRSVRDLDHLFNPHFKDAGSTPNSSGDTTADHSST